MLHLIQGVEGHLSAGKVPVGFSTRNRRMRRGDIINMIIGHLPAIDWIVEGKGVLVFLIIWQLINYSIDTKWIMSKEFIDGSLDNTGTFIRRYTGGWALHPPFWTQYSPDAYS